MNQVLINLSPSPSERTEAVPIEVSSPILEESSATFPSVDAATVDKDAPPAVAATGTAQQVTPWDVQGAIVEGKQVRSDQ